MKIHSFRKMLVFAILLSGILASTDMRAQSLWATLEARPLMEAMEVVAVCYNPSASDRPIFYQMVLERKDEKGNSVRTSQGGPAEVKARDSAIVDVVVVSLTSESEMKVILRIYEMNYEVAADSMWLGAKVEKEENLLPIPKRLLTPDQEPVGLVLDETRTRAGREFYDLFYNQWMEKEQKVDYLIRIEEYPFQLRTTLIKIFLNEMEVFQQTLLPNTSYIENLVGYAVGAAQFQLENYEQIQRTLEGEDVQGTGIY